MKSLLEDRRVLFIVNCLTVALIIALAYIAVKYVLPLLLPFFIGWIIAVAVDPAVRFLNRKLFVPRRLASLICVLLVVSVVGFLLYLLIARIGYEFYALLNSLPAYLESVPSLLDDTLQKAADMLSAFVPISPDAALGMVNSFFADLPAQISKWVVNLLPPVAVRLPIIILYFFIVIISSYFISVDYRKIRRFLMHQVPNKYKSLFLEGKGLMKSSVVKLLKAYLIIMLIGFAESMIALSIIRLPYAVAVSVLIAVVDILPVLGSGTILLPWALYSLIVGNYFLAIYLVCFYAVYVVVRQTIEPKIVGDQLGINPLVLLMAIFIGLRLFGALGIVVMPVALIVLKYLNDSGRIRLWSMPSSSK